MPMLTSLTLPTVPATSYGFSYNLTYDAVGWSQGLLKDITLPTLGKLEYTYQLYTLPSEDPCTPTGPRNSTPGIRTRTLDGSTWTYLHAVGPEADVEYLPPNQLAQCEQTEPDSRNMPAPPQRWSRTSILSPPDPQGMRRRSDHYFSIYAPHRNFTDTDLHADTRPIRFAEPVVAGRPGPIDAALANPAPPAAPDDDTDAADTSDAGTQRFLSTQIWSSCDASGNCAAGSLRRSTHRRYADMIGATVTGRPPLSERTTFHDDLGCADSQQQAETCYTQITRSEQDRAGHYRATQTVSNRVAGAAGDVRRIEYPELSDAQALAPSTPWVLTRYTETSRTIGSATARKVFGFDANGFLLTERTLLGADPNPHDILTVYAHNAGNVMDETTYGGDVQDVGVPGEPQYWNRYTWEHGRLARRDT
jgi:hypothetical protein